MKTLITVIFFIGAAFCQERIEKTIQLKNGDKVFGTVLSDTDSLIVMMTSFGDVSIPKTEIKLQRITLCLKDGSIVSGGILLHDEREYTLQSSFGVIRIEKETIDRTLETDTPVQSTLPREIIYNHEHLSDIFFDPTGYTLGRGAVYFNGLSWGVAASENVEISSSYWRYFLADVNIRPKFQIYKGGDEVEENALAAGFHLHSGGPTGKKRSAAVERPSYDANGNLIRKEKVLEWQSVGTAKDYFLWTEVFAGVSHSLMKKDGRGRTTYHAGASVIFRRNETMPRLWVALESDVTDRFTVIGQAYYDHYQPSYREMLQDVVTKNPFNIDFGLVYAFSESFRVGIHYQPYIMLLYFKL